jgi:hypothetical protein
MLLRLRSWLEVTLQKHPLGAQCKSQRQHLERQHCAKTINWKLQLYLETSVQLINLLKELAPR